MKTKSSTKQKAAIDLGHDKNKIQGEFALMLRNFLDIPKWKIFKRWRVIKEIRKFVEMHKDCCEVEM